MKAQTINKPRRAVDSAMVLVIFLLLLAGLTVLFSATFYAAQDRGDPLADVKKQLVGVLLGAAAMAVTANIHYAIWKRTAVVMAALISSLVLLILVVIPGIGISLNGSRRWLNLAGISFQPSEWAKFAVVIYMATILTNRGEMIANLVRGVGLILIVPAIFFLLILEQPNLSTAGSILIVSVLMIFIAGASYWHLAVLGSLGLAVGAFYAWSAPYRRERLLSFRDPFAKMSDEGYQLAQSLIAFGSGGLFGMGLGRGRQKYAYLPYPESDFIFAIVGEDFGLLGCLAVICLFAAFMFIGMRIAVRCPDKFGCLLCAGITCLISVQAFLNMGVVVGILPTTGLPLPFFSAGGTSISIVMAMVGIILNISREARE